MKILFTNSPLHFSHGHTFTQPDWQTLILPYLAGIVGPEYEIKLVDNMHSFLKSNRILNEVKKFQPDLIGFSIIASRDIFNTLDVIKQVRSNFPKTKIIAGGQASSYYYEWLLNSGVDIVVHGEGEKTLEELVQVISNDSSDYAKIEGISYLLDNSIKLNNPRKLMKTLDEAPIPRFDLMPLLKSKWFTDMNTGSVEMSRGCSYDCNFCAISSFWKSFRRKSNDKILQELEILYKQNRRHIYLADDNFGMGEEKHIDLFKKIIKEKWNMKFFAQIRTDTIANHPEMIEWAAKTGFYGMLVGFDTYNKDTFNNITKTTSLELNVNASKILRKNNIAIFGTHIYGLPDQKTPLDFYETFKMGRKYSDLFRMPHFSPLPFTKGYEDVVPLNPKSSDVTSVDQESKKDFRPRVGDEKHKKIMKLGYDIYTWIHNLSPSEISGALFHSNPAVRRFKQQGYIATSRHYLYKFLRDYNITDI